jgi:hypothetical protein
LEVAIGHIFVLEGTDCWLWFFLGYSRLLLTFRELWSLYFYDFTSFVGTTLWTRFVCQNWPLTVRTGVGINKSNVVLLTGTVTTMAGVSLLWKSHKNYQLK